MERERLVKRLELLNRVMVRADFLLEAYRSYIAELFVAGMEADDEVATLNRLSEIQQERNQERVQLEREIIGATNGQLEPESTS